MFVRQPYCSKIVRSSRRAHWNSSIRVCIKDCNVSEWISWGSQTETVECCRSLYKTYCCSDWILCCRRNLFTVRYELYYAYELLALEGFINAGPLIPAQWTGWSFKYSVCVCVCVSCPTASFQILAHSLVLWSSCIGRYVNFVVETVSLINSFVTQRI